MFTIEPNPTFVVPVKLPVPGAEPVAVKFRFRHMDAEEFQAMLRESREAGEGAAAFLARFVDGWEGENINAPFSREALEKLCRNYPKAMPVIFRTFETELIGALPGNW